MAGQSLVALDRKAEALDVMRRGVEVAAKKGDAHAGRELEAAIAEHSPA
jgi:hypothetical protein